MDGGEERTESAENNGENPQSQDQILAMVVGRPAPDGSGLQFGLQLGPGVSNPIDFGLVLLELALAMIKKNRTREQQQQQIAVPKIHLPPGFGGSDGPAGPPLQFPPRGRRGKGRG